MSIQTEIAALRRIGALRRNGACGRSGEVAKLRCRIKRRLRAAGLSPPADAPISTFAQMLRNKEPTA